MTDDKSKASKEIYETLRICNFCIGSLGISLIDDIPKHFRGRLKMYFTLFITSTFIVYITTGQYLYIINEMRVKNVMEGLIGSYLHIAGYGLMSLGKLVTIWGKRHKFRKLVNELADIWPVSIEDKEEVQIKQDSISALKNRQIMYTLWTAAGVWFFNLTPIVIFIYYKARGMPSELGYVYRLLYPFDKTKPINHVIAYVFEACAGSLSVCVMLGTDLLFMTMTGHIGMLLRLLQVKIRNIIKDDDIQRNIGTIDCYEEIITVVKIHQRLIHYIEDLEEAFTVANLINVLISSINICCCTFNIVFFDPWMQMHNKSYLGAVLIQMGIVCWYADDIFRASVGVSDAVYESAWYRADVRSRRALLLMLQRSQKPLYFTALKFSAITMATFSSVLTSSYSYFTLFSTSYKRD